MFSNSEERFAQCSNTERIIYMKYPQSIPTFPKTRSHSHSLSLALCLFRDFGAPTRDGPCTDVILNLLIRNLCINNDIANVCQFDLLQICQVIPSNYFTKPVRTTSSFRMFRHIRAATKVLTNADAMTRRFRLTAMFLSESKIDSHAEMCAMCIGQRVAQYYYFLVFARQ